MIIIVLAALIGFICGFHSVPRPEDELDKELRGLMGILGIMAGGLLGFLACMFASVLFGHLPVETTHTEYQLVQVSDNVYGDTNGDIHGGLFLIHGNISTSLSAGFSYYQKVEDGYELKTAEATNSIIKYSNGTPRVVIEDTHCLRHTPEGPYLGLWFFDYCDPKVESIKYTFYVPDGSVHEDFNLGENK